MLLQVKKTTAQKGDFGLSGWQSSYRLGCNPSQPDSKAVAPPTALALEGWRETVASSSFFPAGCLGDDSGTQSRSWFPGLSRKGSPSPRLLSHHFLLTDKSLGFLLSLKPLLVPVRHRLGLSQSCSWMGLSDSALSAQSKRTLGSPDRGTVRTRGDMEVTFSPLLTCSSELEPSPWYRHSSKTETWGVFVKWRWRI